MHTGQQLPDDLQHRQAGETTRQYVARVAAAFDAPERAGEYSAEWAAPLIFERSSRIKVWRAEKVDGPARNNVTAIADYLTSIATSIPTLTETISSTNNTGTTINRTYTAQNDGVKVQIADPLNNAQLRNIANAVRAHLYVRELDLSGTRPVDFVGLCILLDLMYERPDIRINVPGIHCALHQIIANRSWNLRTHQQTITYSNTTVPRYSDYCANNCLNEHLEIGDINNPLSADPSTFHFNPQPLGYVGTGVGITLSALGAGFALADLNFAFFSLGNNVSLYQCLLLSGTTLITVSNALLHYLRYTERSKNITIPLAQYTVQYAVPAMLTLWAPLMIAIGWSILIEPGLTLPAYMAAAGFGAFIFSTLVAIAISIDEVNIEKLLEDGTPPHTRNAVIARSLLFILANTTIAIMTPWLLQNTLLFSDPTITSTVVFSAAAITSTLMLLVNEIADATKPPAYERLS